MLKGLRVGISAVLFILITFYFIDFAGLLPDYLHRLAKVQFIPALLASNVVILTVLVVLTLLLGRIYCSVVCPLGIFQDVVSWVSKHCIGKKKRFRYVPAKNILRWSVFGVVVITFIGGFSFLLSLLDPYSAYGRMSVNLFKPVYMEGNNILESVFSRFDNYSFYRVDITVRSVLSFVIALVTFGGIGFLAWGYGRSYCNTVCPVGTVLGFLSRYSFFKVKIDGEKCNRCGLCAMNCKASCINSKEHAIDYSRCVDCFDCLTVCRQKAIRFVPVLQKSGRTKEAVEQVTADFSRRHFLSLAVIAAMMPKVLLAQERKVTLFRGISYRRKHPVGPPGSVSTVHLRNHCTACQLCVSKCPSHVLKPAFMEYGLSGMMQPLMSYEKGFCNYDCTLCGEICPTGAIKPLTIKEKHQTQAGRVVFIVENCIVHVDETSCGACSEHCPTQAVSMVPYKEGLTIPSVHPDLCVGCGGCEYVCPAKPYKAIHVEGNTVQRIALAAKSATEEKIKINQFGF